MNHGMASDDSGSFVDFGSELDISDHIQTEIVEEELQRDVSNTNIISLISNERCTEYLPPTPPTTNPAIVKKSETELYENELYENISEFSLSILAFFILSAFLITIIPESVGATYISAIVSVENQSLMILQNARVVNCLYIAITVCAMSFGNLLLEVMHLVHSRWNQMSTIIDQQRQQRYSRHIVKELSVIMRAVALIVIFEECIFLLDFWEASTVSPTVGILLSAERVHMCIFIIFLLLLHITDRSSAPRISVIISTSTSLIVSCVYVAGLIKGSAISDKAKLLVLLLHFCCLLACAFIPSRHLLMRVFQALSNCTRPEPRDARFALVLFVGFLVHIVRHFFGTRSRLRFNFGSAYDNQYALTEVPALIDIFTGLLAVIVVVDVPARMAQLEAARATEQTLFDLERQRLADEQRKKDALLARIIPTSQRSEIIEDSDKFVFYRDFTGGVHFYKRSDVATGRLFVDPATVIP